MDQQVNQRKHDALRVAIEHYSSLGMDFFQIMSDCLKDGGSAIIQPHHVGLGKPVRIQVDESGNYYRIPGEPNCYWITYAGGIGIAKMLFRMAIKPLKYVAYERHKKNQPPKVYLYKEMIDRV